MTGGRPESWRPSSSTMRGREFFFLMRKGVGGKACKVSTPSRIFKKKSTPYRHVRLWWARTNKRPFAFKDPRFTLHPRMPLQERRSRSRRPLPAAGSTIRFAAAAGVFGACALSVSFSPKGTVSSRPPAAGFSNGPRMRSAGKARADGPQL